MAPILLALVTGAFIGSYTIVDGLGARAAGSAHGYTIWLSLITALLTVCCVSWLQRDRRTALNPRSRNAGIAAGITGYGSTWVVIWALAPLAMVSAPARNRKQQAGKTGRYAEAMQQLIGPTTTLRLAHRARLDRESIRHAVLMGPNARHIAVPALDVEAAMDVTIDIAMLFARKPG
ncbi:MAG: hypothetical protein ACXWLB_03885 [Reyranella sp.]